MKSTLLAAVSAAAGICLASEARAATVRIVQQDTPSTLINTSLQAAVNECDGVTPCLVKVMPGTYDLGTAALQLKPLVTLEGGGPELTIIRSANTSLADYCDNAVVKMANGSVLRQLAVVNAMADSGSGIGEAIAVSFNGVSARAEFVHALSAFPSEGVVGGSRIGVCVKDGGGSPAAAELVHVYALGDIPSGQGNGLVVDGVARVNVKDSRLAGSSGTGNGGYAINTTGSGGSIVVKDSVLEAKAGATGEAYPIWAGDQQITVSSSQLSVTTSGAAALITSCYSLTMVNTTVTTAENTPPLFYEVWGTVRIANSQLPGDRSMLVALPDARLVGNYDQDFLPIPNKQ